jgi:putative transposase
VLRRPIESTQYTSTAYQAVLAQHGLVVSLSGRGNCYDNAVAESFFATLKIEGAFPVFDSLRTARSALFDFIEVWYNRQRLHSSLGYQSPTQYEQQDKHRRAHPARVA